MFLFRHFKRTIFNSKVIYLGLLIFVCTIVKAQLKKDSIFNLLNKSIITSTEKWEILEPFLISRAYEWESDSINYIDTLIQLAISHLPNKIAASYALKGELYFNKNELEKSLIAFQEGLNYVEISDDSAAKIKITRGIGNILSAQDQHRKARKYYFNALKFAEINSDTLFKTLCHLSIANTLMDELFLDSAAFHLYLAQDLAEQANLKSSLPKIYNNIIFLEDERKNYEIARSQIFKLITLANEINDMEALLLGYGNLGYSYGNYDQQYDSAVFYLKLGLLHFGNRTTEPETLPAFYSAISDNYFKMGFVDSSLIYLRKYTQLNNSILQKKFNNNVQEIEAKYQNEEKEKQLIQSELEKERQTNLAQWTLVIALIVILILISIFQYIRNRQKLQRQKIEYSLRTKNAETDQLRKLDQLKSNFFANISHEFRTPLTLILGPLEQLKNNKLNGNINQYAEMMHRNAFRLKELINQLLELSKLESGKLKLDFESGNIYQFSRQLAASFESWASQKDIKYHITIPDESLLVLYDRDKYEKILTNLISNAIKYTPSGGWIHIIIQSEKIKNHIKLIGQVQNSGEGIHISEREKIFQRFYQSTKISDDAASGGIGLALTKELVELHKGKIRLTSNDGTHTEFKFEIPYAQAKESTKGKSRIKPLNEQGIFNEEIELLRQNIGVISNDGRVSNKYKPQVLVIEDNEDVRQYIIDQIKYEYHILQATNGQEGLKMAFEYIPDLIITDLMMPIMSGMEVTLKVKKDELTSHIPVIMLTAKVDNLDKLKGLEIGADDYLTKPFNAAELKIRIKNLISQRTQLKERFSKLGNPILPKEIAVNSVDEKFLIRLIDLLETEMDNEQLTVESLSHRIGMSRSQLHRKLVALTNKTPSTFIRTFRIHRAKQLLLKKAGNMSEIAFMVGFSSLAYFSKCYKDEFGHPPSEVLKQE